MGYQQLHEDPDTAIADIVDRYHQVADQCDAVLIVGSDYTDVAAPERAVDERPYRGQPRRAGGAGGERQGPHARGGRAGRRAVPGRDRGPARAHRCGGGQPLRSGATGRGRRRAEAVRAAMHLRAARGAAAGRAVGGRTADRGRGHGDQWRPGPADPRSDGRAGGRHDGRARAGAADRRRGGDHAGRPIRRCAGSGECPCGRRLSVAVVRDPQRWTGAAPVDRLAGVGSRTAAADHHDRIRHIRDRQPGGRRPGPGHREVAAQDRHRAGADGHPRRHRGSACAAGDSDPVGGDPADVHLPAAGPGPLGPQAHRAARGRRRPHPARRRGGCCSAAWPT